MIEKSEVIFAVFDIDGTLIDSKKFYRKVILRIVQKLNSSFLNRCYSNSFSLGTHQGRTILQLKRKIDSVIYGSIELIDVWTPKLFKGVRNVLQKLKKDRIKIFATSGSKKAKLRLQQTGILDFFELVLGREIPKEKHIPIFAEHLGINLEQFARQAIYVGDELEDMILARRFGLYGIGITNTLRAESLEKAGAQKIIDSFEELLLA